MEWQVNPTYDINGIHFGTDREVVRAKLGMPIKEFKKSKFSQNTTDDYGDFHIFYDKHNNFEAIEIFEGTVTINGKVIFPEILKNILAYDNSFIKDDCGCTSTKLEIGVYTSNENTESILIGCKGYY